MDASRAAGSISLLSTYRKKMKGPILCLLLLVALASLAAAAPSGEPMDASLAAAAPSREPMDASLAAAAPNGEPMDASDRWSPYYAGDAGSEFEPRVLKHLINLNGTLKKILEELKKAAKK